MSTAELCGLAKAPLQALEPLVASFLFQYDDTVERPSVLLLPVALERLRLLW